MRLLGWFFHFLDGSLISHMIKWFPTLKSKRKIIKCGKLNIVWYLALPILCRSIQAEDSQYMQDQCLESNELIRIRHPSLWNILIMLSFLTSYAYIIFFNISMNCLTHWVRLHFLDYVDLRRAFKGINSCNKKDTDSITFHLKNLYKLFYREHGQWTEIWLKVCNKK